MATYSDLNLSFKKHPGTKDILIKTDLEVIKDSLRNILLSSPYDVPFDPNFGSALRPLLFEPLTPPLHALVKRNVIMSIGAFDNRIIVASLDVSSSDNDLYVDLVYYVENFPEPQQIHFVLERMR